jgi:hypothetical protein
VTRASASVTDAAHRRFGQPQRRTDLCEELALLLLGTRELAHCRSVGVKPEGQAARPLRQPRHHFGFLSIEGRSPPPKLHQSIEIPVERRTRTDHDRQRPPARVEARRVAGIRDLCDLLHEHNSITSHRR